VVVSEQSFSALFIAAFGMSRNFFAFLIFHLPSLSRLQPIGDDQKKQDPISGILEIRFCSVYLAWNTSETSAGTVLLRHICMYGSYKMEREPEGTSQVRAANIVVIESYLQKKRIKEIDSYST
jgi:hypothetical protein